MRVVTDKYRIFCGDSRELLKKVPDNSIDAVVTDPPYGLNFMGKKWDYDVPQAELWAECLRVLKPGGHLLSFFGQRTYHRGVVQIEDAGFEIRDQIMWVYGSGFPKSLNIGKAIDKSKNVKRPIIGKRKHPTLVDTSKIEEMANAAHGNNKWKREWDITGAGCIESQQWKGWGTALKPAHEPVVLARKSVVGTIANNILNFGTGALNIDKCRIPTSDKLGGGMVSMGRPEVSEGWDRPWMHNEEITKCKSRESAEKVKLAEELGRWPANLIHDGSEEVLACFPEAKGQQGSTTGEEPSIKTNNVYGKFNGKPATTPRGDKGSAARFFYCAKVNRKDREEGCESLQHRFPEEVTGDRKEGSDGLNNPRADAGRISGSKNHHPTVKPTDLMRYLCRLITPPNGVILDPFMGSGSTGKAALLEGFRFVGIEKEPEYFEVAKLRIGKAYENEPRPKSRPHAR